MLQSIATCSSAASACHWLSEQELVNGSTCRCPASGASVKVSFVFPSPKQSGALATFARRLHTKRSRHLAHSASGTPGDRVCKVYQDRLIEYCCAEPRN
jgi:hypothetical protein